MRALFSDNKCLVSIQENPYWAREANDCRPTGRTHISGRSRPGLPWGKAIKQDPDCPGRSFARVQPQMSIDVVSNLRAKPQDQPPSGDRPPASASNALKYTDWLLRVFCGVDRVKVLHHHFPQIVLFNAKGVHRLDACSTEGGDESCQGGRSRQYQDCATKGDRIVGADSIQLGTHQASADKGYRNAHG